MLADERERSWKHVAELSAAPSVHAAMGFEDVPEGFRRSKQVLGSGRVHSPCSAHGGNDLRAGLGGQIVKRIHLDLTVGRTLHWRCSRVFATRCHQTPACGQGRADVPIVGGPRVAAGHDDGAPITGPAEHDADLAICAGRDEPGERPARAIGRFGGGARAEPTPLWLGSRPAIALAANASNTPGVRDARALGIERQPGDYAVAVIGCGWRFHFGSERARRAGPTTLIEPSESPWCHSSVPRCQ